MKNNSPLQQPPLQYADSNVHAKMDILINASQQYVMQVYQDFNNWNKLFPATIKGTRFIKDEDKTRIVEVDHSNAGKVINKLSLLSPNEIRLEEFKPLYNAIFLNRFEDAQGKTRYVIEGFIFLKGIYKLATPFIKGLVRKRMYNYVLKPMKAFAEKPTLT